MILNINNISKSYSKRTVLSSLSFEMDKPDIFALVAPNGAGKSTLLNCICNLIPIDGGSINIFNLKHNDPDIFKRVSYMQDNRILYPYLTGLDHLLYIQNVQKIDPHRLDYLAKELKISNYINKKVADYSLGMKQNLLIAMTLMNKPDLILMDEPFNGLDPGSVIRLRELIKKISHEGSSFIISSHTLSEVDLITDKILFLKDGKLIYENIASFKNMEFSFKFDNLKIAEEGLNNLRMGLDIERTKDALLIKVPQNRTEEIFSSINRLNIKILDVRIKQLGSEERYNEIFGR